MLFALSLLFLVVDAPKALAYQPKYKPVRLHNGVEFRPSPDGFAFVKNGRVLKRYTFRELGGVPESPLCRVASVEELSDNLLLVGYCIHYEGPEAADSTVNCYMTDQGEKLWCAVGDYESYIADSLGRFLIGAPPFGVWPTWPVLIFTPDTVIVLEERELGQVKFSSEDSVAVLELDLPTANGSYQEIMVIGLEGGKVFIGDTIIPARFSLPLQAVSMVNHRVARGKWP